MEFSPAFPLLSKFSVGLQTAAKNQDDVLAVANYLGVGLPAGDLNEQIQLLADELQAQNGFLSVKLSSDSIFKSDEYRKSMFIREVVANNRINLKNRMTRDR